MPYQDRERRLCGFLNIEETEGSGIFCRRYFVLDCVNAKLIYFMDSPANLPDAWRSPVGEINVHNINKVSDGSKQRLKVLHCFTITVAGRQYFLQAEKDPDKWQWIEALNNASKITVPSESTFMAPIKEWHGGDVSQSSYVTEIAGGVVCKMPIQNAELESDSISDDDESRSSSSGRLSPTSSSSRGFGSVYRDSGGDKNKPGTPQRQGIIKSGYCVKQGAVRKNWKRRYFVLHAIGLSYFKNDQDKQPIRTIPIAEVLEARLPNEGSHVNRDNLFEIITSKRIFYIQCDTPEDVKGWVECVKTAIRHRRLDERKSMQDQRHPLDEELTEGNYPSPIWRNRFMSTKERHRGTKESGRFPKQQDRSKRNLLMW